MEVKEIEKAQGHWLLAKMGKKVLRPGGKELTTKLIENLHIKKEDNIIEFAPGLGYTANLSISKHPKSYTGVDADEEVIKRLQRKFHENTNGSLIQFLNGNAEQVDLKNDVADKIYGEAMLTMHADHRKLNIIKEAHRLLKVGGLYAIHEIGLTPETSDELKATIQKELAQTIRVNARPLTEKEWTNLLEESGFEIIHIEKNGMFLLETKRIIDDEGFLNTLQIGWNIMKNKAARKRIYDMRRVFRKHQKNMNAIVIIARKKEC